jgi:predicted O-methyltransferase YrrM
MKAEAIQREAPESGRRDTIVAALRTLLRVTAGDPVKIVEVGTIRDSRLAGRTGDGWATAMWGWYVSRVGGKVISIDVDAKAIATARAVCSPYAEHIEFRHARAQDVLGDCQCIDLLYMDGPPEPESHLAMWHALECLPLLVLFDDIIDEKTYDVKGALAIPEMVKAGYIVHFARGRQALLGLI